MEINPYEHLSDDGKSTDTVMIGCPTTEEGSS